MYRIFKKKHDLAARNAESRARSTAPAAARHRGPRGPPAHVAGPERLPRQREYVRGPVLLGQRQLGQRHVMWPSGGTNGFGRQRHPRPVVQRCKASGWARSSRIAASGSFEQNPHAAMDANGNFVVTFEKTVNGQTDIIAQAVQQQRGLARAKPWLPMTPAGASTTRTWRWTPTATSSSRTRWTSALSRQGRPGRAIRTAQACRTRASLRHRLQLRWRRRDAFECGDEPGRSVRHRLPDRVHPRRRHDVLNLARYNASGGQISELAADS